MSFQIELTDFLSPLNLSQISQDEDFAKGQYGQVIDCYETRFPNLDEAQVVLVGCEEVRGSNMPMQLINAPDTIRSHFYKMYCWHTGITIADIGNIIPGATLADTYAALKEVIKTLLAHNKKVIILGGSHDLTLAQYQAYAHSKQLINIVCADALIDIQANSVFRSENFLLEMFTAEPNYTRDYCHLGFQSYFVNPDLIETLNKLRFDFYRVGALKENIEEAEPAIRNSHLFSFDINAIAHAYAPSNALSPNGFTGEEACILMQYAGMSPTTTTIGIYGYNAHSNSNELTAIQISQMIWYYIDGLYRGSQESSFTENDNFNEYHVSFNDVETIFIQSKKTARWWMQLPNKKYLACSIKDYEAASQNHYPERWLREQEKES